MFQSCFSDMTTHHVVPPPSLDIRFLFEKPLVKFVEGGGKGKQKVYFNFIARFWGLLE